MHGHRACRRKGARCRRQGWRISGQRSVKAVVSSHLGCSRSHTTSSMSHFTCRQQRDHATALKKQNSKENNAIDLIVPSPARLNFAFSNASGAAGARSASVLDVLARRAVCYSSTPHPNELVNATSHLVLPDEGCTLQIEIAPFPSFVRRGFDFDEQRALSASNCDTVYLPAGSS